VVFFFDFLPLYSVSINSQFIFNSYAITFYPQYPKKVISGLVARFPGVFLTSPPWFSRFINLAGSGWLRQSPTTHPRQTTTKVARHSLCVCPRLRPRPLLWWLFAFFFIKKKKKNKRRTKKQLWLS
jgi:hypothetical protein